MKKQSRKKYSSDFKAKVALAAMRGDKTLAQLTAEFGVHHSAILKWKKMALDGLSGIFSNGGSGQDQSSDAVVAELYAKIGKLTVERDFLSKALNR